MDDLHWYICFYKLSETGGEIRKNFLSDDDLEALCEPAIAASENELTKVSWSNGTFQDFYALLEDEIVELLQKVSLALEGIVVDAAATNHDEFTVFHACALNGVVVQEFWNVIEPSLDYRDLFPLERQSERARARLQEKLSRMALFMPGLLD